MREVVRVDSESLPRELVREPAEAAAGYEDAELARAAFGRRAGGELGCERVQDRGEQGVALGLAGGGPVADKVFEDLGELKIKRRTGQQLSRVERRGGRALAGLWPVGSCQRHRPRRGGARQGAGPTRAGLSETDLDDPRISPMP